MGKAFQYVDFFRPQPPGRGVGPKGQGHGRGMSLPWAEDCTWQTPVASQQVIGLLVDALRSGVTVYADYDHVNRDPYAFAWNVNEGGLRVEAGAKTKAKAEEAYRYRYQPVPKPYEVLGGAPAGGATPILMYAMAHSPSNNPINWRRNVYTHLMHGTKILDMFQFKTSLSGYTCDYVDQDTGMYQMVRQTFSEMAFFDDIVFDGVAQAGGAKVALLYSNPSDLWYSPLGTPGTAKRTLYLALKHLQLPLDIVTESDCVKGHLNHYSVLYITDPQVTEATMAAVTRWVLSGGRVVMTAGAAMLNELNMTNTATLGNNLTSNANANANEKSLLMGTIHPSGIWTGTKYTNHNHDARRGSSSGSSGKGSGNGLGNATIYLAKQDLPYAEKLDTVTLIEDADSDSGSVPGSKSKSKQSAFSTGVYGEKSIFALHNSSIHTGDSGAGSGSDSNSKTNSGSDGGSSRVREAVGGAVKVSVLAEFDDKSPAVVNITRGLGFVIYMGFHPGLSYYFPALPKRPVDRTPVMSGYTNFVPTDMDIGVRRLIGAAVFGDVGGGSEFAADATAADSVAANPAADDASSAGGASSGTAAANNTSASGSTPRDHTHARTLTPHARPIVSSNPLVETGVITRQGDSHLYDAWNGTVIMMVDWSVTGGGVGGVTGYTRVNISIADLPGARLPFKTATLASCLSHLSANGCTQVIPPYSPHNPTNVTKSGSARFNISTDRLSFSVDVLISDAIVLR